MQTDFNNFYGSSTSNPFDASQMLAEAVGLLTNSQYLIGVVMSHSNIGASQFGNDIRKLKRGITDFLNRVQENSSQPE